MRRPIRVALVAVALVTAGAWVATAPWPTAEQVAAAVQRTPEGRSARDISCKGVGSDWSCHVDHLVGTSGVEVHIDRKHWASISRDTGQPPFRVCCVGD
jgi:hypothetical protein